MHYSSEEKYFEFEQYVTGSNNTGMISPGIHIFPFWFQLPTEIPSSFESDLGQVRYAKVKVCSVNEMFFDVMKVWEVRLFKMKSNLFPK